MSVHLVNQMEELFYKPLSVAPIKKNVNISIWLNGSSTRNNEPGCTKHMVTLSDKLASD